MASLLKLYSGELDRENRRQYRDGYSAGRSWAQAADRSVLSSKGRWLETAQRSFGGGRSIHDALRYVAGADFEADLADDVLWPDGFAQGIIDEYRRLLECLRTAA